MDITEKQIIAVEDAYDRVWGEVYGGLVSIFPLGTPPTMVYIISIFCNAVCELIKSNFADVNVVYGTYEDIDHCWIECTSNSDKILIDLSTKNAENYYIIYSERTTSKCRTANSTRDSKCVRQIAICKLDTVRDMYVPYEDQVNPHLHSLMPLCKGHFSTLFRRIVTSGGSRSDASSEQYYNETVELLTQHCVSPDGTVHPFIPATARLFVTFSSKCQTVYVTISDVELEEGLEELDELFKILFGKCGLWLERKKSICVNRTTMVSPLKLDEYCALFYQVVHAIVAVGNDLDDIVTEGCCTTSVGTSLAEIYLANCIMYGQQKAHHPTDPVYLSHEMLAMYSTRAVNILEVTVNALHYKTANKKARTERRLEIDSLEMIVRGPDVLYDRDAINAYFVHLKRCHASNTRYTYNLVEMIYAWRALEITGVLYSNNHKKKLKQCMEEKRELKSDVDVKLSYVIEYTHRKRSKTYNIEILQNPEDYLDNKWENSIVFTDIGGKEWVVESGVCLVKKYGTTSPIGMMFDALCLSHRNSEIPSLRLTPMSPDSEISSAILPMVRTLSISVTPLTGWEKYLDDIHLAVSLLQNKCEKIDVSCPVLPPSIQIDYTKSPVEQWVMYYTQMPDVVFRALDILRQRHGILFTLCASPTGVLTRMKCSSPPSKLMCPRDKIAIEFYDNAITILVQDWMYEDEKGESALLVVKPEVVTAAARETLTRAKRPITMAQISGKFPLLSEYITTSMQYGMAFVSSHKNHVELTFYRNCRYLFEMEYINALKRLTAIIKLGTVSGNNTIPVLKMSGGYLVSGDATIQLPQVIVTESTWNEKYFIPLLSWVVDMLRSAIFYFHIGVRMDNISMTLVPTVRAVCESRGIFFTVTAQVRSAIDGADKSFTASVQLLDDNNTGMYRLQLPPYVLNWIATYAVTYESVTRESVVCAPYSNVKVQVHIGGGDIETTKIGKYVVNADNCRKPIGDIVVVYRKPARCQVDEELYELRVAAAKDRLHAMKISASSNGLSKPELKEFMKDYATAHFFECSAGKPANEHLLAEIERSRFERSVVKEYRKCKFLHPEAADGYLSIGVKNIAEIIYGKDTPLVEYLQ